MSNIKKDGNYNEHDIALINNKRIVFIVDECHRSTFGDMLATIKNTFPMAIFFGFTGTPIHDENQKNSHTTKSIFGNELHRYSIADGIRDKNVLGFDADPVFTFRDNDLREVVALEHVKAKSREEALKDKKKKEIFYQFMNQIPMAGYKEPDGTYIKGIEDYIKEVQYQHEKHQKAVVQHILENFELLSYGRKFHAIFATSSIEEAIQYYNLLKNKGYNVAALFDPSIDNVEKAFEKESAIIEMLNDYNTLFHQNFTLPTYSKYKKDVALRLAHKGHYRGIEKNKEKQLDILIVVDQMLTGYDSKWINTLYLDKLLHYENIIQAFSRTNRLFGRDKPFGIIKYYRRPHTMQKNIERALELYSGNKPLDVFVDKLKQNLENIKKTFAEIQALFTFSGIADFICLPKEDAVKAKFAKLFKQLSNYIIAAKLQGFSWENIEDVNTIGFNQQIYQTLQLRYQELSSSVRNRSIEDIPYEIDTYLTEINTNLIDYNYLESRFQKYIKDLATNANSEAALNALHKCFPTLTQEEQKYAELFLHDVQRGNIKVEENKSFKEYIKVYQADAEKNKIQKFAAAFGMNAQELQNFILLNINKTDLNAYGRFDMLKKTVDMEKAKTYLLQIFPTIPTFKLRMKVDELLEKFIEYDGKIDLEELIIL